MSTFSKWSLPYKFLHFAMHATCLAYLFSSVRNEMCEVLTNVFFSCCFICAMHQLPRACFVNTLVNLAVYTNADSF